MKIQSSDQYPGPGITGVSQGIDPFLSHEIRLRNSNQESLIIYKSELYVEHLPPRFTQFEPAKAMIEEGYIASYRDDRKEDSLHVIEYEDRWEMHIDNHNPRYLDKQLPHLIQDSPKVGMAIAACCLGIAYLLYTKGYGSKQ